MQLQIKNLSKRYPNGVQALKGVNLTLESGMFGLLGPNGAGKSSLMRTLATLQEADEGEVTLGDLNVLTEKDRVRALLGYLPQEFGLYPKVTAIDLLDHFARLKGISDSRARKAAVEGLLQRTNLHEARNRKLGTYSGGMKQRFGIAQALLGDPKLIIVDEPTAGLDPEERVRFHNLLAEIGENIIVILSTHIVSDVSDLCSQMAIIHKGEVVQAGSPVDLIAGLNGKVWRKLVSKEEVADHLRDFEVLATRRMAGRTLLHVHAEAQPDATFEAVNPDLEDVYFLSIRNRAGSPATPGALAE